MHGIYITYTCIIYNIKHDTIQNTIYYIIYNTKYNIMYKTLYIIKYNIIQYYT